ncbi:hypothetical protein BDA96_02G406900 [Sorghum bicolor]|uniref:Uncharacterized protein n=1 Tax=Sorghum bicolor TaxID=4558 RepID=A0A921UY15_SORBI|nr:hypothetical protein BDA96_02G406900 [Sorghum bicolor]
MSPCLLLQFYMVATSLAPAATVHATPAPPDRRFTPVVSTLNSQAKWRADSERGPSAHQTRSRGGRRASGHTRGRCRGSIDRLPSFKPTPISLVRRRTTPGPPVPVLASLALWLHAAAGTTSASPSPTSSAPPGPAPRAADRRSITYAHAEAARRAQRDVKLPPPARIPPCVASQERARSRSRPESREERTKWDLPARRMKRPCDGDASARGRRLVVRV